MNRKVVILLAGIGIGTLLTLLFLRRSHPKGPVKGIDIVSGRVLAAAATAICEQLGCTITYEDPPYVHKSHLKKVSDVSAWPVPIPAELSYDYGCDEAIEQVLKCLVERHRLKGNPGEFSVSKTGAIYNLLPVKYMNQEGKLQAYTSIFDGKVDLDLRDTNLRDAMNELRETIVAMNPGAKFIPDARVERAFLGTEFSHVFQNESVRMVLNEMLRVFNQVYQTAGMKDYRFTWQLRYGPAFKQEVVLDYNIAFCRLLDGKPDCMKLRVEHERPMAAALKVFERRFGEVITFEDALYTCPCDIMGRGEGYKTLAGGSINMDWRRDDTLEGVLRQLVGTGIEPRDTAAKFELLIDEGRFHIYPTMSADANAVLVERQAFTIRPISLDSTEIDALTFLEFFCQALSDRTGESIELSIIDPDLRGQLQKRQSSAFSVTEEKVYRVLNRFLARMDEDISWQLLYDVNDEGFKLVLHDIKEEDILASLVTSKPRDL